MESLENRLHRCAINTATLGHREPLDVTLDRIARAGFGGVAPWRHEVEAIGASAVARQLRALQLTVSGYCRSTYLTGATNAERRASIDNNIKALHDAAEVDARCFVMVVGGVSAGSRDLAGARTQVEEGIAQLLAEARKLRIALAIEPLHPMYAADRSVVNTIGQALALCEAIAPDDPSILGIAIDIYHCWWDPLLSESIVDAGRARRILAYHVSDWLADTKDMLMDRGMMGDGVVDLKHFRHRMEEAGYDGMVEVELFSRDRWWKVQPDELLSVCAQRLQLVC
ncbi:sugar phosphate isomerase/epimerase family protein [Caballeronia ptereochthonis]|uniref:AP endonuclease, family 2 domain protein n=1 Tax=Caballeronia ptereochthonis TaxID=1777144 RepID=A0A158AYV5_9BURK|nr:sugar phosphate isomerase/epimerase family protein [Caballeronia ptereochthonis]SAK62899.1 AP endonuclease, family 2 domain protein [Caballeronia ptereochthonis]